MSAPKPFDPTKPFKTRSGKVASAISCPPLFGGETLVGWFVDQNGRGCVGSWFANGQFTFNLTGHPNDLVNIPVKHASWVNFYPGGLAIGEYSTREAADKNAPDRIACILIEFEEGQGL